MTETTSTLQQHLEKAYMLFRKAQKLTADRAAIRIHRELKEVIDSLKFYLNNKREYDEAEVGTKLRYYEKQLQLIEEKRDSIDKIFARFEEFINSNDLMLVNREELKVVWAVRDRKVLKGFLRIGRKHIPFYAAFNENNDLTLWIPGIGHIFFENKTIQTFLEEEEESEKE